jgi:hypothetical protein
MNVMRPLLACLTLSAKPCASRGTAGLDLSQLVSMRYSAALIGAVNTMSAAKALKQQRPLIFILPFV